ncbi:glycerol dehydrogenase [Pseudohalocynthiibacter sp. F2068]|jgi:glycerol dehydrogenase|uniref:glycerol dehydrogenase n=1 Tax=Pseudohalocynthiibacter sp. F2068 TaxID=2926418 RepID=UPI001FF2874F|nr:glycerol dehydrogenase [Pseudohalocynthiibacter sp. F2068]MCK0104438.1 glycerol dehydrogenase [Pseudohalocynthiibacter sp. F2068]
MNEQLRIFGAPSRYIQGEGALSSLGEIVSGFSRVCFVVSDGLVLELYKNEIERNCRDAGVSVSFSQFGGECTYAEIRRMASQVKDAGVIVGLGGGKAIDTAKGISLELGLNIIIVPTIASNDSPTSRLAVIYDEDHHIVGVERMPRNPDAVLVDSAIIAKAPVRFLISGIGDAISKKFEAELCARSKGLNFYGGRQTSTALALSDYCYHQIRKYSVDALKAARQGLVTPELDEVIEAAILQSGLGFENGGLAIAHGLTRGMVQQKEAQRALHGELVAWGLLVQLIAENRDSAFIADLRTFYRCIGLPLFLSDLGFENTNGDVIDAIAHSTWTDASYVRIIDGLSAERIATSIRQLEKM